MPEPAVGAGLVHRYLGVSAMAGCVLGTLLTIPCQFLVGRAMSRNNSAIMQAEDQRLQASTEALHNMKTIKVGLSQTLTLQSVGNPILRLLTACLAFCLNSKCLKWEQEKALEVHSLSL